MSAQARAEAPDLVTIEIDGRELKAPPGAMIIQVADEAGIDIPRFCYHRKLSIAANCRMCLVEVEKAPKPMPACATPVADGMKIYTETPHARSAQKGVMEFLLINHPLDCPICDQGGECELQDLAMGYGRSISRFAERKRVVKDHDIGPLIQTDMTRCIYCTRCVRFLEEIGNTSELGGIGRGEHTEIVTYIGQSITSELSGNVIDLCPVGALTDKPYRYSARAWELSAVAAVSPHDATGSNLWAHRRRGRIMRIVPRDNEALNESWISDRDRYGFHGLYAPDRVQVPMIRQRRRSGMRWEETDWETALDHVADNLGKQLQTDADAVGFLASPRCTVEEAYLIQKLARSAACPNVDHRLRQVDFSDQDAMPMNPALGLPVAELETLDAAFLVGCNLAHEQPLLAHRIRKAQRRGARLMVVNPVDWDFHVDPAERLIADPYQMLESLADVAKALAKVSGAKPTEAAVKALLMGRKPGDVPERMAWVLHQAGNAAVVLGDFAWQHPAASQFRALARFIAEASSSSLSMLPGGPNVVGAWVAGAVPHRGPGGSPVDRPGHTAAEMLSGKLRSLVLFDVEPGFDTADAAGARDAINQAEFVVSVGAFADAAILDCADVVLPAAPAPETSGSYVNAQADWQMFEAAAQPTGEARPLWKILRVLGGQLGLDGFDYLTLDQVREEMKATLEAAPVFEAAQPAVGEPPQRPAGLVRTGEVPIYAGDSLLRRSEPLQSHPLAETISARLCAEDAKKLDVAEGEQVAVIQGDRRALATVRVDDRIPSGSVRIPAGVDGSEVLGENIGAVSIEKS